MQISAVDLLANLMKEKTTSLILIVPYVCVQEAESHAYSYCNLKENISAKIFIFYLNGERFALTITQLSVVVVVKELPGQRVRHIGDDCLVVGHAGDSKNWKYAKQCQTFIFINNIH